MGEFLNIPQFQKAGESLNGMETCGRQVERFGIGGVTLKREELALDIRQVITAFQHEIADEFRIKSNGNWAARSPRSPEEGGLAQEVVGGLDRRLVDQLTNLIHVRFLARGNLLTGFLGSFVIVEREGGSGCTAAAPLSRRERERAQEGRLVRARICRGRRPDRS